ncbi:MAG: hypothetical protein QXM75_00280 [Candidatus Diapherotrites archaeon]
MVQLFVPGKKDVISEKIKPLEEKFDLIKQRIIDENIQDDNVSAFLYQFEKELEKARAGDESALKRAALIANTLEEQIQQLSQKYTLDELRSKIRKPIIEAQVNAEITQKQTQPKEEVFNNAQGVVKPTEEEIKTKEALPKEEPKTPKTSLKEQETEAKEELAKYTKDIFEPIIEEKPTYEAEKEEIPEELLEKPLTAEEIEEEERLTRALKEEAEELVENVEEEQKEEQTLSEEQPLIQTEKKPKKSKHKPSISIASFDKETAEAIFKKSLDLIKKSQLETGGITVGTTTSLHYIYPRAHLLSTLGLIRAGKYEEAKKALLFAIKGQNKHTGALPQRWDYNGNDVSYRKVEPDCTALFLYVFADYVLKSSDYEFAEHYWERIEKAIDFIDSKIVPGKNLVLTPASIHEYPPMDAGYEIWCNAVCGAAFRDISIVADRIRLQHRALDKQNLLREAIMSFMWNSRLNTFIKTIKVEDATSVILGPDASVLALSFFNIFPPTDDRLKSTVEFTSKNLKYQPLGGIMDYPPTYGQENSGTGANTLFTLLLTDYYISQNNFEEAKSYLQWALSVAYDGKLPKYIATVEDFEALVSDLNDAGLLDRETLSMIENTRKHPDYSNSIAHILEPYLPAHSMYVVVWEHFKSQFGDKI